MLGINPSVTDGSNVFTIPAKYTTDTESVFERLHAGRYTLLMRSRIRTVMNAEGLYRRPFHTREKIRTQGKIRAEDLVRLAERKMALQPRQRILPWLALNEVFIGEFMAARPITLHVGVENHAPYLVRSSGICVCTGTGSRFWYKSINVQSAETVRSIVEIATGDKLSLEETNELLHKYHQALLYSAEDLNMIYMIREIYHTTRCTKRKCCPDRQKCSKLTVKSCGFDAGLVIDGSISLPFNDGAIATFDIKPEYSLRSIVLT
ncbi:NAD kinase 2, mitochondrial-like [Frieseomelitta varia]|uniref:NAD kinase 2, mitochondrial-like n=1 Tax=Frieseomelitta varia TaxID=561572 RepID=UPI001CB679C7|nr:NAD kinase 2, mitochondrial-like [Frieseomelitta varia]